MHQRLSLALRIMAWTVAVPACLAAALAVLAVFVAAYDWNGAKPWLTRQLSAVLSREIRIDGEAQLSWSQGPEAEAAATRFIPRLRLQAHQVFIGNPGWATASPYLARADFVDMRFALLPLLRKHWRITDLQLRDADIVMERADQQRKNWRFSQRKHPLWSFDIHRLDFDRARIRYVDRLIDLDLRTDARPKPGAAGAQRKDDVPDFAVDFTVGGRYKEAPLAGRGQGGPLLDLLNDDANYPMRAEGEVGQVHTVVNGMFHHPRRLLRADLTLSLRGASLADLHAATGVPLPATHRFETQGQLSIAREDEDATVWDWRYRDFTGKVGESDFAGNAQYVRGVEPARLRVTAHSARLRLSDLAQDDAADKSARRGKQEHMFQPENWSTLDAEIDFSGDRVEQSPSLQLHDAVAQIRLKEKVLSVAPLTGTLAGGKIEASLSLDGRQEQVLGRAEVKARGLQVRRLFAALSSQQASVSEVYGGATLTGRGNSVAQMLATADGKAHAVISDGSVSKFILEAAGLNVADAIFAKVYRDKQVHLNCAIADLAVSKGRAEVRKFRVDTEDAVIDVSGHVDLAQEQLDLNIHPNAKSMRVLSLRTPLYARGSFRHPDIGPYTGQLAARAGAAAALALVAPVAAVLPLISMGKDVPSDCPTALADAKAQR